MADICGRRVFHGPEQNAYGMITGFILQIFYAVLAFFIGLLPSTPFPQALANAFSLVWGLINSVSFLLPVSTLVTVLGIAMVFHAAILLWRLSHLVGGYIRGR